MAGAMIRICLDSSVIIYLIEGAPTFHDPVIRAIQQTGLRGAVYVLSDLTRLECRVRPLRENDPKRLGSFDAFFAQPDVVRVDLSTALFDRATWIRAHHSLKVADAIHLATALEYQCDEFWTGDRKLAGVAAGFIRVSRFDSGAGAP